MAILPHYFAAKKVRINRKIIKNQWSVFLGCAHSLLGGNDHYSLATTRRLATRDRLPHFATARQPWEDHNVAAGRRPIRRDKMCRDRSRALKPKVSRIS